MFPLLDIGLSLIDKILPDEASKAAARLELLRLKQSGELKLLQRQADIIVSESKSDHFIVAAWRPLTMLIFSAIIANNYLIYPYLSLFWSTAPVLELPAEMWGLLKIGLGGYVVGRSAEKIATSAFNLKNKNSNR